MSELEQAKSDWATARAAKVLLEKYGLDRHGFIDLMDTIQAKIKELEAPPDPFRRAKHLTEIQRKEKNHDFFLADYAIHLEDEVERLKDELAKRPVMWCLKNYQGCTYTENTTKLFHSMKDAAAYAKRHGLYWLKADVYTGEKSE